MAKNAPPNGTNGSAASHNGTAHSAFPNTAPNPAAMPTSAAQTPTTKYSAAPADALPRPDHEYLGGPRYVSGPICRETDAPVRMAEEIFRLYQGDVPPRILELQILLDSARSTAEVFRQAQENSDAAVRERRAAQKEAQAQFCVRAANVRTAQESDVSKYTAQLDQVVADISRADRMAFVLHAEPGVPPAAVLTATSAATSVVSSPPTVAGATNKKREHSHLWSTVGAAVVGTMYGIAAATEQRILDFQAAKELESDALVWLAYAMVTGAVVVVTAHHMALRGFQGGGERAAQEASSHADLVNWKTLRHAVAPTLLTFLVIATEAVVMRNAFLAANWGSIPDPSNFAHYLNGLVYLLPVSGLGAVQGWREGIQTVLRQAEEIAREEKHEKITQQLQTLAPAQRAHAFDAYVAKLYQRKAEILAEINERSQPYKNLIGQFESAFSANPAITADEARILQAAREDAVAAYARFLFALRELRSWQENTANPDSDNLILTILRGKDIVAEPPPKLSWWQRLVQFFRRLFNRKQEDEKASAS